MPSGLCSSSAMHGEEVEKWEKVKEASSRSQEDCESRVDLLMNPVNGCVRQALL